MNRSRVLSLLATIVCLALGGCEAPRGESQDDDEIVGTAEQGVGNLPPEGNNHFHSIPYWAKDTHAAFRYLASVSLHATHGRLPSIKLSSSYRDEILQNLIECALSPSQTLIDPVTGHSFSGWWGLATTWYSAPLTDVSQRRFVTACTAQRLNATGTMVPILLKGAAPPINYSATLDPQYPWDESTVFGDMFSSTVDLAGDQPPFQLYVCSEQDLLNYCVAPNTPSGWLQHRICDTSPKCGLTLLGQCLGGQSPVCGLGSSGYELCQDPGGTWWTETVHVQLQSTSATCSPAAW